MRNYEPNLRVWYGRQDFVNMVKRWVDTKDNYPSSLLKIIKNTIYCTYNNVRTYEEHMCYARAEQLKKQRLANY